MSLDDNPWEPPSYVQPTKPQFDPNFRPGVITGFTVYAILTAVLMLFLVGIGLLLIFMPASAFQGEPPDEVAMMRFVGGIYTVMGLVLSLPFVVAPFLPRKGWVWIYNMVLICLGFTSCLTLPFCIWMLVLWLKPETKWYYGRT
jgi:hypothetical protein